jgi:DNA end-binding protein Ku
MARPIWKGAITFGLVNVPIQLEMAVHDKMVHFNLMSSDGNCRLRQKLYCPETKQEFDFSQTARGIEIAKGEYVLIDEKEIDRLKPEHGRTIEIVQFIKQDELDPIYFDRVYFIVPTESSIKPYKLLCDAISQANKIALARFVMREREYLAAIRPLGDGLVLHTMHYEDEVETPEDAIPAQVRKAKSSAKEVAVARELIDAMTKPLDLSKFKDDYRLALEQLIERRKHGQKTVEISESRDDGPPRGTPNLMAALRRSLHSVGASGNGRSNGHSRVRARITRPRRKLSARKR